MILHRKYYEFLPYHLKQPFSTFFFFGGGENTKVLSGFRQQHVLSQTFENEGRAMSGLVTRTQNGSSLKITVQMYKVSFHWGGGSRGLEL